MGHGPLGLAHARGSGDPGRQGACRTTGATGLRTARSVETERGGGSTVPSENRFFGGSMNQEPALIRQRLKTPRAAAIAGIIFSVLFMTSLVLIWVSIPDNPLGPTAEVISHLKTLSLSFNLFPFAGIAFLWFIAVVRDRLGELEDRFFSTVYLGSG